jgi:double-strand break repair protein MRE11
MQINYFGRQDEVDKVEISPILLKKGSTKVALYGLGSLRDERLNRMWERQKVRFLRPDDDEAEEDDEENAGFFNIFTLHQNRDLGRGTKNCVQETMIPEWMDIVVWVSLPNILPVYRRLVCKTSASLTPFFHVLLLLLMYCQRQGHEHECLIEFFESVVGTFRITQPGSSVATSLVSGEAARKKVGILDIKGKDFRLHPVPLTQVRSFVTTELSLREHRAELDPEDPKIDTKVTDVLEEEVQLMVLNARERTQEVLHDSREAGSDAGEMDSTLKYKLQRPGEVLVRIRVEHNGFSTLNNQRFGAKFVGDVANPSDILLFHRKKDPKLASTVKKKGIQPIAPEELERANMEDLIREQLAVPEGKLKILGEKDLSEALENYVDRSLTAAIADVAGDLLDKTQKALIKGRNGEEVIAKESQVFDILERDAASQVDVSMERESQPTKSRTKRKAVTDTLPATGNEDSMDDDDDGFEAPQPPSRKRTVAKASSSRVGRSAPLDDSSDEDIEISDKPAPKASAKLAGRPQRGATKRKVAYAIDESDGDDDFESDAIVDDDDEDDDIEVEDKPLPPSKRKMAAPKSRAKPKAAPVRKTTTSGTARKKAASKPSRRNEFDDSDDDVQYVGESADLDVDWGSAATRTQRSAWS